MKPFLGMLGVLICAAVLRAQPAATEPAGDVFSKRVDACLKSMNLPVAQEQAAYQILIENHRTINELQDAFVAAKTSAAGDKEKLAAAKQRQDDGRAAAHKEMLERLSGQLSAEQIEQVKDAITVNKVRITYDVYCQELPQMTGEQKAHVLDLLQQAREKSLDCASMKERDTVFKDFKGKINVYLSKQGLDQKAGEKQMFDKIKADKAATTQAS